MTGLIPCDEMIAPPVIGAAAVRESYRQDYTRLFVTALLITGSVVEAEGAIEQSVGLLDLDEAPGPQNILIAVVRAVLACRIVSTADRSCASLLPSELRTVLGLDADLRRCFVLRRLAGFSTAQTAGLLRLGASDVEAFTRAAILKLAEMAGGIQ
jgi:hypothetical protein